MKKITVREIFLFMVFILLLVTKNKWYYALCLFLLEILMELIDIKRKKEKVVELPDHFYSFKKMIIIAIIYSLIIVILNNLFGLNKLKLLDALIYFLVLLILLLPMKSKRYLNVKNNINYFKLSCVKTVIVDNINNKKIKNQLNKLHMAHLNLIIIGFNNLDSSIEKKFKKVNFKDLKASDKKENLIITGCKLQDIKTLKNRSNIYYKANEDLDITIEKIKEARGICDNLIKCISLRKIFIYPIVISLLSASLFGFPLLWNVNILLFLSFFVNFLNRYIWPYLPFDKDIMERKPRNVEGKLFSKQEILVLTMQIITIFMALIIPFMSSLTDGGSVELANSLALNVYFWAMIFFVSIYISEQMMIINVFKSLKNIYYVLFLILTLLFELSLFYLPYCATKMVGGINYGKTLLIALVFVIWFELIKLARVMNVRKKGIK